jgi:predicted transcriptional regulator of viral defense system
VSNAQAAARDKHIVNILTVAAPVGYAVRLINKNLIAGRLMRLNAVRGMIIQRPAAKTDSILKEFRIKKIVFVKKIIAFYAAAFPFKGKGAPGSQFKTFEGLYRFGGT